MDDAAADNRLTFELVPPRCDEIDAILMRLAGVLTPRDPAPANASD